MINRHLFYLFLGIAGILSVSFQAHAQIINGNINGSVLNELDVSESENLIRTQRANDKSWFSRIPSLPSIFLSSPTLSDGKCKQQTKRYLHELHEGTLWAVKMFDSSVKYPEGIITGTTRHYGNFDECYNINATISGSSDEIEVIAGRYCLVDIEYRKINSTHKKGGPYSMHFNEDDSAWKVVEASDDWRQIRKDFLRLALCVPSACSYKDVEEALQEPLRAIGEENGIFVQTTVLPSLCQSKVDKPERTIAAKIFGYFFLVLVSLVCIGTFFDNGSSEVDPEINDLTTNILLCFSLKRNLKSLMTLTPIQPTLDCLHFLRVCFMLGVIFVHRNLQHYENPVINGNDFERGYENPWMFPLVNGPVWMDSCLAVGSFLLSYYLLAELDRRKKMIFFDAIIMRFLRLTPTYAVVIAFTALILPELGSGPMWQYRVINETTNCAHYWWTKLFYIDNYVHADKQCILQSWYLSVDFQLFIMALIVVYLFWKMPRKLGYPFLFVITAVGFSIRFYHVYYENADPIIRITAHLNQAGDNHNFVDYYIKTGGRIASYFVGIFFGALLYDVEKSQWKLSKFWSRLSYFVSYGLFVYTWSAGVRYLNPNDDSSKLSAALYGSLAGSIITFCALWIIMLATVGQGLETARKLVVVPILQPVAKLSYGVFLVAYTKQLYDIGSARQSRTSTPGNLLWDVVGDIILSFTLALILSMCVEMPFRRMEKLAQKRKPTENEIKNRIQTKKIQ